MTGSIDSIDVDRTTRPWTQRHGALLLALWGAFLCASWLMDGNTQAVFIGLPFVVLVIVAWLREPVRMHISAAELVVKRRWGTQETSWESVKRVSLLSNSRMWGTRARIRVGLLPNIEVGPSKQDGTSRAWGRREDAIQRWAEAAGVPVTRRTGRQRAAADVGTSSE